ncbi:MAG: hypothetical protein NUV51_03830 [Sulfuricaulis sp.]|nr:hypothetical protein [Sulfuricaulis sp.]
MARKEKSREPEISLGQQWLGEIESAGKDFERWEETSQRIVRRYRDDRDAVNSRVRRFNILWSNVQVMKPALYGRMPKPSVTRRFLDSDPVGRTASMMLERSLEFESEQYPDFNRTMKGVVEDRLLPGRGVAWVRYEPHITGEATTKTADTVTEDAREALEYECAPTDYVYWKDFRHEPARTWEEVNWVARRVYMDHDEGTKRFGGIFTLAPLQTEDKDKTEYKTRGDKKKKAEVWEIWDKTKKQVVWIAKGLDRELDVKPDPLELEGFFPCPMPLYSTVTTGSLVPVPDYCEYQDQAEELDSITNRISKLTRACKVVGVYDASVPALKRMLEEGVDNTMVPVTEWESFSEKNGLKGSVQFLPLKEVIEALVQLYNARESAKQVIYETMGISDILRGATQASETLGAQKLKAEFGSMRMRQSQEDVARFATDLLRMKAHIICTFFSDDTILKMSGVDLTQDAELAQQAIALLRRGPLKDFRIEVNADTLAQLDESKEREERVEFLKATGSFLEKALPVIQAQPEAGPLLGEMLMFGIRGYHVGRSIEATFERAMSQMGQALQQPKGPPPEVQAEQVRVEAQAQSEQTRQQFEMQKFAQEQTMERERMHGDWALEREKDERNIMAERDKHAMQLQHDRDTMGMQMQNQSQMETTKTEANKEIEGKRIEASAKPAVSIDGKDAIDNVANELRGMAQMQGAGMMQMMQAQGEQMEKVMGAIADGLGAMAQAMEKFNATAQLMTAPREIVVDPRTGRKRVQTVMQ